jgi:copper chaperone CopZ
MATTTTYEVTGMTCGHCVSSVTEAVTELPEVDDATVELDSRTLIVIGKATPADVTAAVADAGYQASIRP